MGIDSNLDGWERYPENLDLDDQNGYKYDGFAYHEELVNDAERLFIDGRQQDVKVIEFGLRGWKLDSIERMEEYLKAPRISKAEDIEYSWGSLMISLEAICKLFTSVETYPAFIDVLRAFGEKTNFEDDSYSGFRLQLKAFTSGFEISYLVKHADRHGRAEPEFPWSFRQMGIYQRNDLKHGDTFIIVNPSDAFLRRVKKVEDSARTMTSWEVHMMIMSCAMSKWRWCLSDLERDYANVRTKAQLSDINDNAGKAMEPSDICFGDTQDLQVLQDNSIQISQYLDMNRHILHELQNNYQHFNHDGAPDNFVSSLITDVDEQFRRTTTILKRLDGTLNLVRSILDFQCLESLRTNSKMMTEMTQLSHRENELILELTEKASRDTDTLKMLTLLTLVYLPASFVSSMMGMGYIIVRGWRTNVSTCHWEFWMFLLLTVILLICTLGSYAWWLRGRQWGVFGKRRTTYESI